MDWDDVLEKIDKALGVIPLGKVEVYAVVHLLNVDGVLVGAMLEDELLEVEESALVRDLLADLDDGAPGVVRVRLCAVGALVVVLDVLDLERLLHDGALGDLLLHRDLDLDAPGMRLRPDEARIDDSQLVEPPQLL